MRLHDTAFYVAAFAILGVGAAGLGLNPWLTLIISAVAAIGFYSFSKFQWKYFLILPIIAFLGFFYYHFYFALQAENIVFDKELVFQGEVIREPTHSLKAEEIDVRLRPPS